MAATPPHDRRYVSSRQPPCRRRPADRAGRGGSLAHVDFRGIAARRRCGCGGLRAARAGRIPRPAGDRPAPAPAVAERVTGAAYRLESGCDRLAASTPWASCSGTGIDRRGGPVPPGFTEHERRRWLGIPGSRRSARSAARLLRSAGRRKPRGLGSLNVGLRSGDRPERVAANGHAPPRWARRRAGSSRRARCTWATALAVAALGATRRLPKRTHW